MTLAGAVLDGRYELDEQVGAGGYGEVWRAVDNVLSRPVAVKLLYPGAAGQPGALARFQAEARHAGALSHQNIARVYDYGEPADGSPPYLVMELVDGPSLSDVLASGPLDTARTMDIVAQTAAGLQAAHAAGLVHRDVKPANLLLDADGMVKITDFGIANTVGSAPVTITGQVIGTPGYLAPERVAGEQATSASDLYALGIVAYECLAGTAPFAGTPLEIAIAHGIRPLPPLPPPVPSDIVALVMLLTAKDPAWRPASAADVARSAGKLRDGLRAGLYTSLPGAPAEGLPAVFLPRSPGATRYDQRPGFRRLRRRPALAAAALVTAGVTGLVLATTLTGSSSGSLPVSVSSSTSAGQPSSADSPAVGIAAEPAASSGTGPASSPSPATAVRQDAAASPAASQRPAGNATAAALSQPGHKKGKGHGHGGGKDKDGNENGNAQD
jgi:eukaryotic-like serine/threonine-protein kinase